MARSKTIQWLFTVAVFATSGEPIEAGESLAQRVATAVALFDGVENRFVPPDPHWFENTQQALIEESERVGMALDSHGEAYSAAWKEHLRWPLLVSNLGDPTEIKFAELALVRRWLYSNRKGLEYPFFAQLRKRADEHLDAAYTFTQPDLESYFRRQVELVRMQILALAAEPSDAHAADLGRTLGWFEQTRQLPAETAATRSLLSNPNAQVIVAKPLLDRVVGLLVTEVEQTLQVSDRVSVPNGRLFRQPRTANVRGTARTHGQIALELTDNPAFADLQLIYRGEIESRCRAVVGPVTVAMQTFGPVRAVTPLQISLQSVQLLASEVFPQVETKVTGVSARREIIRRLGERRANAPASLQHMNSRASEKTSILLKEEIDDRVAEVIEEVRAELKKSKTSLDSFQEVLAPVAREGATPSLQGISSSAEGVTLNVAGQRREQFGAVTQCPIADTSDVQVRLHVSFFNNMAETIMAGKTFTDKYFMRFGKILQAELPPQLMVHARSVRWAIIAAKPRPLEITIPAPNEFKIQLRMQQVEIGEEQFTGPTIATIRYVLRQDEYDEYQLDRLGEVELDSPMPQASQDYLQRKLSAFFAPVLDAGGVALPEGGTLGRLSGLQAQRAKADQDWLMLGINLPTEALEAWLPVGN